MIKTLVFFYLLLFSSCESLIKSTDKDYGTHYTKDGKKKNLSLFFSNNINGETHPCGCRKHPLGGLAQVAGYLHSKKEEPSLYVDTGDTFFPSPSFPKSVEASLKFTAKALAKSLSELNLKYFVPGDQDLAAGLDFLKEITKTNKITILLSNSKLNFKPYEVFSYGDTNFYFIGTANPNIYKKNQLNLTDQVFGIAKALEKIKELKTSKPKKIILLSHSGMEVDKDLAKKFPEINWIIGSHSQSFTTNPVSIGKTQLVQVMSRNHYLGEISLNASSTGKDSYEIIEMRDEKKDLWKNNPFIIMTQKFKTSLQKIQKQSQSLLQEVHDTKHVPSTSSCIDCHQKQVDFWRETPHSIAFLTLVKEKAEYNSTCIECHSLNFKKEGGFFIPENIVSLKKSDHKKYIKEMTELSQTASSIREMTKVERKQVAQKWAKLDAKFKVKRQMANIQCLHCHNLHSEHPFESTDSKLGKINHEKSCVKCHNADQSPEWYNDKKLNKNVFQKMLHSVSCPESN